MSEACETNGRPTGEAERDSAGTSAGGDPASRSDDAGRASTRDGTGTASRGNGADENRVIVVGPDGMAIVGHDTSGSDDVDGPTSLSDMVEQPAKVMRIGSMIKQLLDEVKSAPLDEASRQRLVQIHHNSIRELEQGLSPELVAELERLSLPFAEGVTPSESDLRIAQAQLVGWLEGLFHGIQTMLFAQQMAARAQLEQMRRGLPPGISQMHAPDPTQPSEDLGNRSGPYL